MAALPQLSIGLIDQIDSYIAFLETKKASTYTVRNYNHHLRTFVALLSKKSVLSLDEVQHKHIISFKSYLKKQTYSPQTQFSYLSAIRSFLKWSAQNNIKTLDHSLVILPRIQTKAQAYVRGSEIDKILLSVNTSRVIGKRDKAILEILFATGIKASELVNLEVNDVDFENRRIQVRGKRSRVVIIPTRALSHLAEYLQTRRESAGALFISYKGRGARMGRMTVRSIQRLLHKYSITPTILRRSFASDLLLAGESVINVQRMLGNQSRSGVSNDRSIIV